MYILSERTYSSIDTIDWHHESFPAYQTCCKRLMDKRLIQVNTKHDHQWLCVYKLVVRSISLSWQARVFPTMHNLHNKLRVIIFASICLCSNHMHHIVLWQLIVLILYSLVHNPVVLASVSKVMQAVKLFSNKILNCSSGTPSF